MSLDHFLAPLVDQSFGSFLGIDDVKLGSDCPKQTLFELSLLLGWSKIGMVVTIRLFRTTCDVCFRRMLMNENASHKHTPNFCPSHQGFVTCWKLEMFACSGYFRRSDRESVAKDP